ncbi:MAG: NAD(+) synthase [Actinobacteria bacterium]|nr:NAD(+) synthase [Actinomycetota bacterium]
MAVGARLTPDVLELDPAAATDRIVAELRTIVGKTLRRRGAVLGISGGIDSSVTCALCARAFGPERVLGVLAPETDSETETLRLSHVVVSTFGVPYVVENITPILAAARCYERRDETVRELVPAFTSGWKLKVVLPDVVGNDLYRVLFLVVESPDGRQERHRLTAEQSLAIVAATNFKQRTRKMIEYYHADRLNYAVAGTPNRLEYDQGFFVKNGDGAADVKPIAHLYKTQVYRLAEYLGVPEEIRVRPPTTDTYSLPQSQEEFFFSLPYQKLDLCLYAHNHGLRAEAVADAVELSVADVERVFRDIEQKRRTTRSLHMSSRLVEPVAEIDLSDA